MNVTTNNNNMVEFDMTTAELAVVAKLVIHNIGTTNIHHKDTNITVSELGETQQLLLASLY